MAEYLNLGRPRTSPQSRRNCSPNCDSNARADYSATQFPVVATSFPGSLSYQSRSVETGMREPWERGCRCRRGCCHCRCCPCFPRTHLPSIIPSFVRGSDRFGLSPMRVSLSFATSSSIIFMSGYSLSTSWKCGDASEYRLQVVAARTEATRRASFVNRQIS